MLNYLLIICDSQIDTKEKIELRYILLIYQLVETLVSNHAPQEIENVVILELVAWSLARMGSHKRHCKRDIQIVTVTRAGR